MRLQNSRFGAPAVSIVTAKTRGLLALIAALGLVLRLIGIGWSLPDARHPLATYHPDEVVNLSAALQVDIPHGRFDVGFYNYGAFYFYLVSLAHTVGTGYHLIPAAPPITASDDPVAEGASYVAEAPTQAGLFLAGRLVTVLMGVLTIPVLFALGNRLYGKWTGLGGALFYAIAPLAVVHSHFMTVDVPATLFVTLALLWSARLLSGAGWKQIAVAGLWCGLAAATKYTAGIVVVAPIAACLLAAGRPEKSKRGSADSDAVQAGSGPVSAERQEIPVQNGAEPEPGLENAAAETRTVQALQSLETTSASTDPDVSQTPDSADAAGLEAPEPAAAGVEQTLPDAAEPADARPAPDASGEPGISPDDGVPSVSVSEASPSPNPRRYTPAFDPRVLEIMLLLAAAAATFLIACPGPWLNWSAFWNGLYPGSGVRYELFEHARTGHGLLFVNTGPGWWYHLTVSLRFGLGVPLLLLALAGSAYAAFRRETGDKMLLIFLFIAYALTSLSAVRFARYLIPLYPVFCILAARLVTTGLSATVWERGLRIIGVVACLQTLIIAGGLVHAMALPDPRDLAADYLLKTAPPQASIAFAHVPWFFSPPLSPWWGAIRSDLRVRSAAETSRFQFRLPADDWDTAVLTPPPAYVVLSSFETIHDVERLKAPQAVRFVTLAREGAKERVFAPPAILGIPPTGPIPEDLLYILPRITLYERVPGVETRGSTPF